MCRKYNSRLKYNRRKLSLGSIDRSLIKMENFIYLFLCAFFHSIGRKLTKILYIGLGFHGRHWYLNVYLSSLKTIATNTSSPWRFACVCGQHLQRTCLLGCCSESTERSLLTSLYTADVMSSRAWWLSPKSKHSIISADRESLNQSI